MKTIGLLLFALLTLNAQAGAKKTSEHAERIARMIAYTGPWEASPGEAPAEAHNAPEVRYWKLLDKASEWIETQPKVSKELLEVALFIEKTYPGQSVGSSLLVPKKKDPEGWNASLKKMKDTEAKTLSDLVEDAEAEETHGNNAP